MNGGKKNNCRYVHRQISDAEPSELNAETAAKTKYDRRENAPEIKQHQIQFERGGNAETLIILTERDAVGNRGKDKAHQCPRHEEKYRPAPVYLEITHDDSRRLYKTQRSNEHTSKRMS